jgi:hypothetical protein
MNVPKRFRHSITNGVRNSNLEFPNRSRKFKNGGISVKVPAKRVQKSAIKTSLKRLRENSLRFDVK